MTAALVIFIFLLQNIWSKHIVIVSICSSHLYHSEPIAFELMKRGHDITYVTSVECQERVEGLGAKIFRTQRWNYESDDSVGIAALIQLSKQLDKLNDIACNQVKDLVVHSMPDLILADFFSAAVGVIAEKYSIPFAILHFAALDISAVDNERVFLKAHFGIDDNHSFVTKLLSQTATCLFNYITFSTISDSANRMRKKLEMADTFSSYSHLSINYPTFTMFNPNFQKSYRAENVTCLGIIETNLTFTPISNKISKFIEDSSNPIMYVSFGSELKPEIEMHKAIMNVLSNQKEYSIIHARYPHEYGNGGRPDHVLAEDFVAQRSLLRHKKVKIFLSHCGLNSVTEAIEAEVVLICLPLGRDQFLTSRGLVDLGIALEIKSPVTEETVQRVFKMTHQNYKSFWKNVTLRKEELYKMNGLGAIETFLDNNAYKSTRIIRDNPIGFAHKAIVLSIIAIPILMAVIFLFMLQKCVRMFFIGTKLKIN